MDNADNVDFNRLDKLIRIDDPRMGTLDKDTIFERSKRNYDLIKFLRNGTEAKFKITYDGQDWLFRPLSIQEDHDCEMLALDDLQKLAAYKRTEPYKRYRVIMHKLSKALSSCPESEKDIKLSITQLECLPEKYVIGLLNQYELLMADVNPDVDKISKKELEDLIEVLMDNPKYLSNCSLRQLQLISLELLKTNIALRGN